MLTVKVKGSKEIEKELLKLKSRPRAELERRLLRALHKAKRKAPVDRGLLRASLVHGIIPKRGLAMTLYIGSKVHYSPWMEFGRKPGKMPPVSALRVWARRHKVDAYLVARKIKMFGIRARRFIRDAIDEEFRGR